MEELWGKKVLIIRAQESIITRGIARKLEELECAVTVVAEDDPNIKEEIFSTELVMFYLDPDFLNNTVQRRRIAEICQQIETNVKKTVIVGEKDQQKAINEMFPVLEEQTWLYRPVDMALLEKTIRIILGKPKLDANAKQILIVDDDPTFCKMIRGWLKDYYKVSVVTSGTAAFAYLAKKNVDLILLDYDMPVTDGPKVLEMLRMEKTTAHIPVIFLTGISTKEEVNRVLSLKPNGYILKSTSFTDLLTYLEEFFKKH